MSCLHLCDDWLYTYMAINGSYAIIGSLMHIRMLSIIMRHCAAASSLMMLLIAENNSKVETVTCNPAVAANNVLPKRKVTLAQLRTALKVGMASISIASLCTSNHRVKTRNWNRCHAHVLVSYSALCIYASASKCDVALGWYCILHPSFTVVINYWTSNRKVKKYKY